MFIVSTVVFGQTAIVKGVILDGDNRPVDNVNVSVLSTSVQSNENGFYRISVPTNKKITLLFSHITFKRASVTLSLKPNEEYEFNLVMNNREEQMGEVVIIGNNKKRNKNTFLHIVFGIKNLYFLY